MVLACFLLKQGSHGRGLCGAFSEGKFFEVASVWDIVMTGCGGVIPGLVKNLVFAVGNVCVDIRGLLKVRVINESVKVLDLRG